MNWENVVEGNGRDENGRDENVSTVENDGREKEVFKSRTVEVIVRESDPKLGIRFRITRVNAPFKGFRVIRDGVRMHFYSKEVYDQFNKASDPWTWA